MGDFPAAFFVKVLRTEDGSHTNVPSTLQLLQHSVLHVFVILDHMLVGKAAILFVSSAFFEKKKIIMIIIRL